MCDNESLTPSQLAETVMVWSDFTGPWGLRGQTGETTLFGETVWMTRTPNADYESGFSYMIYNRAAWAAFGPTVTIAAREGVHA
jgi:hypothetical protein